MFIAAICMCSVSGSVSVCVAFSCCQTTRIWILYLYLDKCIFYYPYIVGQLFWVQRKQLSKRSLISLALALVFFFIFTSVEICFWLDCPRDLLESHNFFLPTVYISLTINIVPSFKLPYIFYWLGTNTFVWSDWFHIYWKCLVFARRLLIACCSYS